MTGNFPIMRRPVGHHAHPLLIDQVVYVKAGRTEAETERRIAEACGEAGIDPARAVACVGKPPAGEWRSAKSKGAAAPGKAAIGPDFERDDPSERGPSCHSTT